MTYAIFIQVQEPARELFEGRDAFRVVINALDAVEMPAEIFVHKKTLISTGVTQDEFEYVASVYDLSIYPAGAPNQNQVPAFFRKATIDVLLPSVELATRFNNEVKTLVDELLQRMEELDNLEVVDEYWLPVGYTPPTTTTPEPTTTTTTPEPTTTPPP